MRGVVARLAQGVDLRAEVGEVLAEALDALLRLLLLLLDELLAREVLVLVDGLGEGGDGGGDVANLRGRGLRFVVEGGEFGAESFALAEGRVVCDVLRVLVSAIGSRGLIRFGTYHFVYFSSFMMIEIGDTLSVYN